MGLILRLLTGVKASEVCGHEREELEERRGRCPAWTGFPFPWAVRSRCDKCRGSLGYVATNLAVPRGTPVVCGPCAGGLVDGEG